MRTVLSPVPGAAWRPAGPRWLRGVLPGALLALFGALGSLGATADETATGLATAVPSFGHPLAEVFTTEDYGQQDQNWDVLQGRNGLIYVGNGFGLMEWDGERWRTYHTPNRTRLRSLVEWHDGRIYAGTTNDLGYFDVSARGGLAYVSLTAAWPEAERNFGETWSVAANDRWVVFCTAERLFVYDGEVVRAVPDFAPGPLRVLEAGGRIMMKPNGGSELLELLEDDAGLRLEPRVRGLPVGDPLRELQIVTDAAAGGERWLLVMARSGVLAVRDDEVGVHTPPAAFGEAVTYGGYLDDDGYLYVSTLKHGLFLIDPEGRVVRNYRKAHSLGTDTILAVTEDDQGNLWLAGAPAITRLLPPWRFSRHVTEDDSQQLDFVVRHEGRIYLGGFGFYLLTEGEDPLAPPVFRAVEGMRGDQVWNALSLGEDLLLSTAGGVKRVRFAAGGRAIASEERLVRSTFAYEVVPVPGEAVFFAGTSNGLHRLERLPDGSWRSVQVQGVGPEMRYPRVEPPDIVWVASEDNKLLRVTDVDRETGAARIDRFDAGDGIGESFVIPVAIDGAMRFASPEGLLAFTPGATPPFAPSALHGELFGRSRPDVTAAFLPDGSGRLWYEVDGERVLARPRADGWRLDRQLFAALPQRQLKGLFPYASDEIWLIFDQAGIIAVTVEDEPSAPSAPRLALRSVHDLATDTAYYLGHGPLALPELEQGNSSVRIRYALADYRSAGGALYRTRLLGSSDERWSEWSGESRKDYTLLGGGRYVFEVQARDGSGAESEVVRLPFAVAPPWYAAPPAIAAYVLVAALTLALAGYGGARWRKRQSLAREQELERLVAERTEALASAIRQLEAQANSDGLTGLANRRLFDRKLEELAKAGRDVALLFIDVDHFKRFNDTQGHLAGDDLLRSLARVIREGPLPDEALAARYGGEEFAVVLPGVGETAALELATKLRERVVAELDVTVSIGVAQHTLTDREAIDRLIKAADNGLYAAKLAGRNRVIARAS